MAIELAEGQDGDLPLLLLRYVGRDLCREILDAIGHNLLGRDRLLLPHQEQSPNREGDSEQMPHDPSFSLQ